MSSKLVISGIDKGLETGAEPFLIDNDSFPVLNNAYVWRKRVLRKRGNNFLGRLQRDLEAQALGNTDGAGAFSGNILTILSLNTAALALNASLRPGSVTITIGAETFTDILPFNGVLVGSVAGAGTIDYQTGDFTITGATAATAITITFSYYPNLPVMGLESFETDATNLPRLVAFDTRYSYEITQPVDDFFDITFYRATALPFTWSGENFEQFWTENYEDAMFTTNGVFGFHFTTVEALGDQAAATITITLGRSDLVVGDVLFFNEIQGTTITGINERVGVVATNAGSGDYTVTFQATVTITGYTADTGIAQLLTNISDVANQDGIRWYDGNPIGNIELGWVNFMPPLSALDLRLNALSNPINPNPDYLVGARSIVAFKGRLLFLDVTIAQFVTHGVYNFVRFKNRVVFSQDGTPYYTVNNDTDLTPTLVPVNQTADPQSWAANRAGRGGFIGAPISETLVSVQDNEDVLLTGFETSQLKLIFTGDDSLPFIFQTINSELGTQSTFSGINLDAGVLTFGEYGFALTTQVSAQRIDLQIPDQVFDIRKSNGDDERVTAVRDFRNEWIYFTYAPNTNDTTFPSKTLLYNYRDNTWATFDENFTTYGTFRRTNFTTWSMLGEKYGTWARWNDPWSFGSLEEQFPLIIGGNQHGFVMIRDSGTFEARSEYIQVMDLTTTPTVPVITSPDHGLDSNEFIEIVGALGDVDPLENINNVIFQIDVIDLNTFNLLLDDAENNNQFDNPPSGDYIGDGTFRRISKPNIQTKQFPGFWDQGRQTRIGTQQYFLQATTNGQLTINLFMSQADNFPVNDPDASTYQIYSQIVLTSPEPESRYPPDASQMWHRLSSSFIGDTVQIGITLSDDQMRVIGVNDAEIALHSLIIDLYPGPILA